MNSQLACILHMFFSLPYQRHSLLYMKFCLLQQYSCLTLLRDLIAQKQAQKFIGFTNAQF